MTSDPESTLFDFAASNRAATNEEEKTVTELHTALGTTGVPLRLRRPPVLTPAPQWRRYMYAAVTVALVLAVATAGFVAIQQQSSTPSPTDVPEVVLGLAGQQTEGSDATPVASPIASIMRDPHEPIPGFGATERDMPVLITYADSLSESKDWWPFNPVTSQFQIRFDTEHGFAELEVRNGVEIHSTFYPNIFLAYHAGGVQIVNISSLTMITIQTEMSADDIDRLNAPIYSSRWMVIQDANLVVDTKTMKVTALNEVLGITSDRFSPYLAATNDDGSSLILAIDVIHDDESRWRLAKFNPDGTAELVPAKDLMLQALGLALSPDGERVIVRSSRVENNSAIDVFTVLDLSKGESADTYEHRGDLRTSDPVWIDNGNAFIYTNHSTLFRVGLGDASPDSLYEAQGTSLAIYKTNDPNTVVLVQNLSYTSPDPVEMDDPRQIIVVDVETGELTVHQGSDQTMSPDPDTTYTRNVAMVEENPAISTVHELDVTVIDTATGEEVGSIKRSARDTARPGPVKSAWGTASGNIQFVTWGSQHTYMVIDDDGAAMFKRITPPPGPASETDLGVTIRSSDDSSWLAMHIEAVGEWWIADMSGDEPEWEQLPNLQQIIFVTASEEQLATSPAATPAASPVATEACDLTGEIPFIAGLNESPLDSPTVLHTTDRTLVTSCNGEHTTLLEDVKVASPTRTPHVIHAITGEGDHFINIVTGEQLFIPHKTDMSTSQVHMHPWGPWMVMRSSTDETRASIYNLETMTETMISTHSRVPISVEEASELQMGSDKERFTIAYTTEPVPGSSYLHGFFIVEADGSSKVVAIGMEAEPRELAVSPDGQLIATAAFQGSRGEGTTTITLFRPEDDTIVQQYQLQTLDQHVELTWQHDGSGLLLRDTFNLYRIDAEHPGDGLEIIAEGQNLQNLVLTPENDVVAISHDIQSATDREAKTFVVHIPTREVIEVDGHDLLSSPYISPTRTTLILEDPTITELARQGQSRTLTVADAVTGESLGQINYEPLPDTSFERSSWGTGQGDISVIAFRPDSMWKLIDDDGNATLEQIAPPPLDDATSVEAITIVTSEDGYLSLRIHEDQMQFTAWLMVPGSNEWIELDLPSIEESQGLLPMVTFISGAD